MAEIRTYRGLLMTTSNGEESLVGLMVSPTERPEIVAEIIKDDMRAHGQYLSVRYFISDQPVPVEDLETELVKTLHGLGEAKYSMRYSDPTGYLWTDEEVMVGGHDLLAELESHRGKYLHLEITYSKKAR